MVSKYAKVGQVTASDSVANRTTTKVNQKRGPSSAWTKANPKYKYGEAMLPEKELDNCGPLIVALHAYYLEACAKQKVDIMVNFNHS